MKLLYKINFVAVVLTLIISCSKGDNENNGGETDSTPRIKTLTTATETRTFTYDGDGKILTETSTKGNKATYTYSANQLRIVHTMNGIFNIEYVCTLNADGNILNSISLANPQSNIEYTYNPDKTIETETFTTGSTPFKNIYYWKNGDLDSIRAHRLSGEWFGTIAFTYYSGTAGKYNDYSFGRTFYGAKRNNIVKSRHEKTPGTFVLHYDYDYTYDTDGKVITKKTTDINGVISFENYTY